MLRAEHRFLDRSPRFVIFDDDDSFSLVKKIHKSRAIAAKTISPSFLADVISKIKNGMLNAQDLREDDASRAEIALDVFREYEDALKRNNAFDFDDLIQKMVLLFAEHPEALAKYARKYPHVLVDEYQDVNHMQYELVKILTRGQKENGGSLSVVGDDQQMIYSWRGSHIDIFLNFENDWPGARTVLLEENYRSTAHIITAASAVVGNNLRQKPKTLWTKNAEGESIRVLEAGSEEEEAEWIAGQIAKCIVQRAGDLPFALCPSPSIAILYRTNAQSRAIEQALLAREIPYRIFGGIRFYERKEIKDAVAAIRYAWNPKDELAAERLEKTFRKSGFSGLQARLAPHANLPPAELIGHFLEATGYFRYLEKNFRNPAERQENIAG
ncbi:MAG: UvrD-helicase domain-containing protein, partial [Patescibacteria group bacterium]